MAMRIRQHYAPGDTPIDRARREKLYRLEFDRKRARFDPTRQFYQTAQWRKLRAFILANNPFCKQCGEKAQHVDHIIPVRQRWDLRLNPTNLQPLCHRCHSSKTAKENPNFHGYKEFDYAD